MGKTKIKEQGAKKNEKCAKEKGARWEKVKGAGSKERNVKGAGSKNPLTEAQSSRAPSVNGLGITKICYQPYLLMCKGITCALVLN